MRRGWIRCSPIRAAWRSIFSTRLYGEKSFNVVLPRHEQGLVHAADGYARATGKTGVCLVTSGPGATNLVTGIATANFDSVPLVCFTGQVPTNLIGNDAFPGGGYRRHLPQYLQICRNGAPARRPRPHHQRGVLYRQNGQSPGRSLVDFPKDIQQALGSATSIRPKFPSAATSPRTGVHMGQLKKAAEMLANAAKRPLFLVGRRRKRLARRMRR